MMSSLASSRASSRAKEPTRDWPRSPGQEVMRCLAAQNPTEVLPKSSALLRARANDERGCATRVAERALKREELLVVGEKQHEGVV